MSERNLLSRISGKLRMKSVDAQNAARYAAINSATGKVLYETEHPVLFFNASTRMTRASLNAAYAWITANSLREDDIPVHFLVCNHALQPCLLSLLSKENLCEGCCRLSKQMYSGIPTTELTFRDDLEVSNEVEGLSIRQLEAYTHNGVPLGELTLPSLRWILRKHHLEDDPNAAPLQRRFIRSAWSTFLQAQEAVRELEPRAIVVFNGLQYPEAVVKWLGKHLGIPTYTHEIGLMPYTAIFTEGEATACPIVLPDDFEMTPERNQKLDDYLSKRMKGSFTTAGIKFWPDMQPLTPEFWEFARTFRQIVPVFTNVVFDTSQKHANIVFSDMFAWLDEVKKLIENHADTLFVIRAHPDENRKGKESRETVTDWVKKNQLTHLPNVLFVGPDEYLSSYELIQNAKFVMVYNSTIGLEAAIMGAAVLCAGKSRYSQVPLCWFPKTIPAYLQKAEELLNCGAVDTPSGFQQTARKFMYYQFFHTALPFGDFIEPDAVWNGYIAIRNFKAEDLIPDAHPTLRIIRDGILTNTPFVIPHQTAEEDEEQENS